MRFGIVAAFIGFACFCAQGGAASPALQRPAVFRMTALEIQRHVSGRAAGDVDISRFKLYNKRVTARSIGQGELVCIFLGGGSTEVCTGSFTFLGGHIVVAGAILSRKSYDLAVVGGTRLFENARGTLTATALASKPSTYILLFRLTV